MGVGAGVGVGADVGSGWEVGVGDAITSLLFPGVPDGEPDRNIIPNTMRQITAKPHTVTSTFRPFGQPANPVFFGGSCAKYCGCW